MTNQTTTDVIARQEWLEPVEHGLQKAVQKTFNLGGETGRKLKDFLHGVWLGDPLHAAVTDVPLGSWTAAIVMDIAESVTGSKQMAAGADAAVKVGLAGAVISAVTGLTDWQHIGGAPRRVGLVHGLLNLSAAGLFATSLILRKRNSRGTAKAVSFGGYAIALASARLGGDLVYRHRIGTDHAPEDRGPDQFTAVASEQELREDQPKRADLGRNPIVLIKTAGRVFALAEKCSHLGGPLAEGRFSNGAIECPWHGSQFSVSTGEVIHGPSVHPQVCFDVRIRDGNIEVRRHLDQPGKGHKPGKEAA